MIEGGQSMNPSAKEIFDAIEAVPTDDVLVLPNNSNVILTAEQAAAMSEKNVRVVPSRSVQAGLAAMAGFISTAPPEDNERAMLEELTGAATGEVTVASRDATLDGVEIREGEYLGLVDDDAVVSGSGARRGAARGRRPRARRRTERSSRSSRARTRPRSTGCVAAIEQRHPDLEVEIHEGGQPHYPLLLVAQ